MRIRNLSSKTHILFSLSLLIALLPVALAAETYEVDASHSTVIFRVKHSGVSYFYGRFKALSGVFTFDEADPAKNRVEIEVLADSVDTENERRDRHLRSPDFFNVKQFPVITFKSKAVNKVEGDTYEITGDLSLHGITKTSTLQAKQTGVGKNRRGHALAGFEAMFTIMRSDFGMTYRLDGLGDEVKLIVSLEGVSR